MKDKEKFAHMQVAMIYSQLSYCKRRKVGAIIVKNQKVISIGYNGTISGFPNICEDEQGKTFPDVLHAESNAITKLAKSNESGDGASLFVTTAPCIDCAKLIIQSGIIEVYYKDIYRCNSGLELLKKSGIKFQHIEIN